jgi:hypothetical protein
MATATISNSMSISPFFQQLRSAYQAEINDMAFDSEGQDVLLRRLKERRKELGFLLQMMQLSPEMVAIVFHQGFEFKQPTVLDGLLTLESDQLPTWSSLKDAVHLPKWSQELSRTVLKEPAGDWFLTVAAALEYMYSKPDGRVQTTDDDQNDQDQEDADDSMREPEDGVTGSLDSDDAQDAKVREEAGADWLAEQGFDRKD